MKLPELDLAGAKSDFWCLFLEGLKTHDFQNLRPHVKLSRDPGKSRNNFEGLVLGHDMLGYRKSNMTIMTYLNVQGFVEGFPRIT